MSLNVLNYLFGIAERHRNDGICAAVIDRDPARILVTECCAGERYVLNVAYTFVVLARIDEVLLAAVLDLPRLILVENASTEAVYLSLIHI